MATSEVNLPPELESFVQEMVKSGSFESAEAVHQAALAAMEKREKEHQEAVAWLAKEAQKGFDDIEAGNFTTFQNADELSEWMDGVLQSVIEKKRSGSRIPLDAEPVS